MLRFPTPTLKAITIESPILKKIKSTLDRQLTVWRTNKPRHNGWYAYQDSMTHGEWYSVGYFESGKWWKFGRHVSLNVRIELVDVQRWRPLTKQERKFEELEGK